MQSPVLIRKNKYKTGRVFKPTKRRFTTKLAYVESVSMRDVLLYVTYENSKNLELDESKKHHPSAVNVNEDKRSHKSFTAPLMWFKDGIIY